MTTLHHDLTVAIPTVGRPLITRCLDALTAGTSWPAEVVIVDQGGNEAVSDAAGKLRRLGLPCVYHASRRSGEGPARNTCLGLVATSYVAFLDDDLPPDADWLDAVAYHLRANPRSIVSCIVKPPPGQDAPSTNLRDRPQAFRSPTFRRDVLFVGGMGAPMAAFAELGGFSEHPATRPAAVDNEWAYRALRAGWTIRHEPQARVTHLDWRDADQMRALELRYARGQGGFYGLHLRRWDGFIARRAGFELARMVKRGLRAARRGQWDTARLHVARAAQLALGIRDGLRPG